MKATTKFSNSEFVLHETAKKARAWCRKNGLSVKDATRKVDGDHTTYTFNCSRPGFSEVDAGNYWLNTPKLQIIVDYTRGELITFCQQKAIPYRSSWLTGTIVDAIINHERLEAGLRPIGS